MQKFLRLNGTTKNDRHQVIEAVKDAIAVNGGWILDFTQFSNLSICFRFELPREKVAMLGSALSEANLQLSESATLAIRELTGEEVGATDLLATLQITFVHDEPDLRIPVPMIPG